MNYKEKPFISAIVYLYEDSQEVESFLEKIDSFLSTTFESYEIILVDDFSKDSTYASAVEAAGSLMTSTTVIRLSKKHGMELALLAGLDKSIGDYIFNFETIVIDYEIDLLNKMFQETKNGNDIIVACPINKRISTSRLFYKLFNTVSSIDQTLSTERVMLISRRALNSLLDIDERVRYMKALISISGFPKTIISYKPINNKYSDRRTMSSKIEMALEILVSYSKIGILLPLYVSGFFLMTSVLAVCYLVISLFINPNIASGWASSIAIISISFFGVFLMLGLISQYVSKITKELIKVPLYTIEEQKSKFNQ
jgi:glycosyltransferase involved in cell wall biosynthesis